MARWVCLLTLPLLVLLAPRFALACKCVPVDDVRELERRTIVFAGRSVEYLERSSCGVAPPDFHVDAVRADAYYDTRTVYRFVVQKSLDLPEGSEALVFTDTSSSCATWFEVGEEHLVVAYDRGGVLWANECPLLGEAETNELRALLRVPASSLAGIRIQREFSTGKACARPERLDQALARADAVGWASPMASCVLPGGEVEHVGRMRARWKGPEKGVPVRIRVSAGAAEDEDFPAALEFSEATNFRWPPADFFHLEGDTYVNDGCDAPLPPRSLDEGIEALQRHLAWPPPNDRVERDACAEVPKLSCSTLEQTVFAQAEAWLLEYLRNKQYGRMKEPAPRPASPPPPARSGSCAGCAVSSSHGDSYLVTLLALLLVGARRFARVRAQARFDSTSKKTR